MCVLLLYHLRHKYFVLFFVCIWLINDFTYDETLSNKRIIFFFIVNYVDLYLMWSAITKSLVCLITSQKVCLLWKEDMLFWKTALINTFQFKNKSEHSLFLTKGLRSWFSANLNKFYNTIYFLDSYNLQSVRYTFKYQTCLCEKVELLKFPKISAFEM